MSGAAGREVSWEVNGLSIAGLSWGEEGQRPLLMLHGWLDNAASFIPLAPLLEGFHIVALDLTGHGRSDHRSADATYQIWDDLPEILGVLDQLGWHQFDLVGHSRGAIISGLLAGAFPERVGRLLMLDAVSPPGVGDSEFPSQLRAFLTDKPALLHSGNRVFPDAEAAIAARARGELGVAGARLLAGRGLKNIEGGVSWSSDRRLHGASAVKLTAAQAQACREALSMPVLLLLVEGGRMHSAGFIAAELAQHPMFTLEYVKGSHHFHMEEPLAPLAARVQAFLEEDRAV